MLKLKKETILEEMKLLPDKIAIDDVIERFFLLAKIEKGIKEADAGLCISHKEAKEKMVSRFFNNSVSLNFFSLFQL